MQQFNGTLPLSFSNFSIFFHPLFINPVAGCFICLYVYTDQLVLDKHIYTLCTEAEWESENTFLTSVNEMGLAARYVKSLRGLCCPLDGAIHQHTMTRSCEIVTHLICYCKNVVQWWVL